METDCQHEKYCTKEGKGWVFTCFNPTKMLDKGCSIYEGRRGKVARKDKGVLVVRPLSEEVLQENIKKGGREMAEEATAVKAKTVKDGTPNRVKCTVCSKEKFTRPDRYLQLQKDGRIDTYVCRACRPEK